MDPADYDYYLPPELIAQEPASERDQARLLFVDREHQRIAHHVFRDLPNLLTAGDLLVLNDTRVLPARLIGRRQRTGGRWEGLFLRQMPAGEWELICQSRGRLHEGELIDLEPGPLHLTLLARTADGNWLARPAGMLRSAPVAELLERYGHVPLPPYVRKGQAHIGDRQRYQTVFARHPGAVAAPTAGLHFTPAVFEALERRGIPWTFLTLHVGLGTFRPIQTEDVTQHKMHGEWGELNSAAVEAIQTCRARGRRVVAVGTTSVRLLETVAATGPIRPWCGESELYIFPPYAFRAVDALVTNFHLPRTTLLLLASAFAGSVLLRKGYAEAIERGYRFYSYGDAMLII